MAKPAFQHRRAIQSFAGLRLKKRHEKLVGKGRVSPISHPAPATRFASRRKSCATWRSSLSMFLALPRIVST